MKKPHIKEETNEQELDYKSAPKIKFIIEQVDRNQNKVYLS